MEKSFDILPAELLRLGVMDTLKMTPLSYVSTGLVEFDIALPESLFERIETHGRQIGCPPDRLIEHLLWQMIQTFPKNYPSPLRTNPVGVDAIKAICEQSKWW